MNEYLQRLDLLSTGQVKISVQNNAENNGTWRYHDLARHLYGWTDIFSDQFLDPTIRTDCQGRLQGPAIGFERDTVRTIAHYILGKHAYGMDDSIILNEINLDRSFYSILETVLHEQVHLWQQRFGEHPIKRKYHNHEYHNQEFVHVCESFGLHPFGIFGNHWKPADGPFEQLLKGYGILKPQESLVFPVIKGEKRNWWEKNREKGKSTLILYQCPCGQHVRVGKQEWPGATCNACGEPYQNIERKTKVEENVDKWIPIREAATIAGYDESTVRNLIFEGKIVYEKRPVVIQRVCVSLKDLIRYKKEVRIGRPSKKL